MARRTGWIGVSFPFSFFNGKVNTSKAIIDNNEYKLIDESIKQIIGTFATERPISKNIGIPKRLTFRNFNEELIPYYESIIKESIEVGEKRIEVNSVKINSDNLKDGRINIIVYWSFLNIDVPNITDTYISIGGE